MNLLRYREDLILPKKAYHGDAGFDIYLPEDVTVYGINSKNEKLSEQFNMPIYGVTSIPTGFGIELSPDEYAQFLIRSSMAMQGLSTPVAVVDSTYKGETNIIVHSINPNDMYFERGERIASVMVSKNSNIADNRVEFVNIRGLNRTGSSN